MKKGFTLIEMLGIIAVLAVVLLVTFPVLNNSLKNMKEDQNENFLKNLKISTEAYIELNRKNYPELDSTGSAIITIQDLYDAELLKGNYNVDKSNQIIITKKADNSLDYFYVNPTNIKEYNFTYTGDAQEFTVPQDGIYKIETWGAQGGSTPNSDKPGASTIKGGFGGYSDGDITLSTNEILYVFVGEMGPTVNSSDEPQTLYAYPNGGAVTSKKNSNGINYNGGGGSTHLSKENKLIQQLSPNSNSLLIVSGGGGGIANWWYNGPETWGSNGGHGGGYIGGSTLKNFDNINATGGTQNEGGYSGGNSDGHGRINEWQAGKYGQGGGTLTYDAIYASGGGGGGYYGGGASWGGGGAGGSGYIGNPLLTNKSMYCYNCEESNEVSTFTVSTTGTSPLKDTTNCPNGYSESPIAKCAKAGNGYARITYLGSAM